MSQENNVEAKAVLNRIALIEDYHVSKIKELQEERKKIEIAMAVHQEAQDKVREIQKELEAAIANKAKEETPA